MMPCDGTRGASVRGRRWGMNISTPRPAPRPPPCGRPLTGRHRQSIYLSICKKRMLCHIPAVGLCVCALIIRYYSNPGTIGVNSPLLHCGAMYSPSQLSNGGGQVVAGPRILNF